jgi:fused signal recognition particle receptor
VLAIARKLKLPIRYVGIGETSEDFGPFSAEAFADALLSRGSRHD